MKKVTLVTLHCIKNYGSVLQTYASQKIIQNLGFDVEVLNYIRPDAVDDNLMKHRLSNSSFFSKNLLTKIAGYILLRKTIKKQIYVFNEFLNNNVNLSKPYYSFEEIKNDNLYSDYYCVGSDQVWNSVWNNGIDLTYYLNFVKNGEKKVSFASSFGREKLSTEESKINKELLKDFKYITVRENSGLNILKSMGLENCEQVLDPTLLLNINEWKELSSKAEKKEKYILVYQLNSNNKKFDEYVKKVSKKLKIKVIRVSNIEYQKYKYGDFVFCPSVNEFLNYFINADYIITDSFHATGFAINFNKKFVDIFPKAFSTRLQSILDMTGLTDRKLVDYNDYELLDKEIDYKEVNAVLENERVKTWNILKKMFNV